MYDNDNNSIIWFSFLDVKDETINLSDNELHFKGKSEDKDYEVNIAFFQKVDSEGSTYKVLPRSVQMQIMKASEEEFWPRLLKDKSLEKNQVKIDWDRYVDEDEEEEAGGFDTSALEGGMGMGGMPPGMGGGMPPGMGGPGGMGGMDMEALVSCLWVCQVIRNLRLCSTRMLNLCVLFNLVCAY